MNIQRIPDLPKKSRTTARNGRQITGDGISPPGCPSSGCVAARLARTSYVHLRHEYRMKIFRQNLHVSSRTIVLRSAHFLQNVVSKTQHAATIINEQWEMCRCARAMVSGIKSIHLEVDCQFLDFRYILTITFCSFCRNRWCEVAMDGVVWRTRWWLLTAAIFDDDNGQLYGAPLFRGDRYGFDLGLGFFPGSLEIWFLRVGTKPIRLPTHHFVTRNKKPEASSRPDGWKHHSFQNRAIFHLS